LFIDGKLDRKRVDTTGRPIAAGEGIANKTRKTCVKDSGNSDASQISKENRFLSAAISHTMPAWKLGRRVDPPENQEQFTLWKSCELDVE
jgi:hypothetical protein